MITNGVRWFAFSANLKVKTEILCLQAHPDYSEKLLCSRTLLLIIISDTCWAEEKSLGLLQMLKHLIGDRHLCMSEGAKGFLISSTHFCLDVVKKQSKGSAAEFTHLPCKKDTN